MALPIAPPMMRPRLSAASREVVRASQIHSKTTAIALSARSAPCPKGPCWRNRPQLMPVFQVSTRSRKRVRGPQSRGAGRSELIGLSSPRKRGPTATGPSSDQMREIAPFQVVFFNELNFPIPIPFLQLLFPADGVLGPFIGPFICLHVYQPVDAVFADECRA